MAEINSEKHIAELYEVECRGKDGSLRWTEEFHNLVVLEGLDDSLDKHFKASGFTSAWYALLTQGTPTFALTDTMASHSGWVEETGYTEVSRQDLTLGTILSGQVNNSASKASFSISGSVTIGGAGLVNYQTKGITSGTIYGGGAFTGGNRSAEPGDTVNVTITLTATN